MGSTRREFVRNSSVASAALAGLAAVPTAARAAIPGAPASPPLGDADLKELAAVALDAACPAGASYADVRFHANRTQSLFTREQRVQGLVDSETSGFGVRALVNGAWGFTVVRPVVLAPVTPTKTGVWRTPIEIDPFTVPVEDKVGVLLAANAALDPVGRAEAVQAITAPAAKGGLMSTGYLDARAGASAVANTKGLFAYHRATATVLATTVRTPDGTGSGGAGASHHDWARIDAASLGARAAEKAVASRNPAAVEPGRYTVVFEPTAKGNLVPFIAFALNARAADEGLPTRRSVWIENGVVTNFNCDRYWAQKTGVSPTASGGSLRLSGGTSTRRDDCIDTAWAARHEILVSASGRSADDSLHGTDARRDLPDRKRENHPRGKEFAV